MIPRDLDAEIDAIAAQAQARHIADAPRHIAGAEIRRGAPSIDDLARALDDDRRARIGYDGPDSYDALSERERAYLRADVECVLRAARRLAP